MNLLAVDIGNTDIKFGIFQNGVLGAQWRAAGTRRDPERFSALLRDSLSRTGVAFDALAYTSVVPDIEHAFRKTIRYCFNLPETRVFAVNPQQIRLPLDMRRYPPEQLGMDRLVNACSARLLYPDSHLIVADFGTATTLDLVTAEGDYLGGAIAPGLQTFIDSLPDKTAKLPHISLAGKTPDSLAMGTNTVACMEAGLGIGYRGLLKELIRSATQSLETSEYLLIGTGGLAETVIPLCGLNPYFHVIDPLLTLKGLQLLYDFNRPTLELRLESAIRAERVP